MTELDKIFWQPGLVVTCARSGGSSRKRILSRGMDGLRIVIRVSMTRIEVRLREARGPAVPYQNLREQENAATARPCAIATYEVAEVMADTQTQSVANWN